MHHSEHSTTTAAQAAHCWWQQYSFNILVEELSKFVGVDVS